MAADSILDAFRIATPARTAELVNSLANAGSELEKARRSLKKAQVEETSARRTAADATSRLQDLEAAGAAIYTRAMAAILVEASNAEQLAEEYAVTRRSIILLRDAIKHHATNALRAVQRSTVTAEIAVVEAEIAVTGFEHDSVLNTVLRMHRDIAAFNGGAVDLDAEALHTGRVAELRNELSKLSRKSETLAKKLARHDEGTEELKKETTK
jgi:hypothetical protein